VDKEGEER
jgi:hypothetical protein